MTIYKNKKAYIVATVFGLSLIIIVPSISFAQSISNKQTRFLKSSVQLGLFKAHMSQGQTHFGVVKSVNGSDFVLESSIKNTNDSFAVNTDVNTVFKKDGVTEAINTLVAGEHVVVMGLTETSNNTISANSVNIITHQPTKNSLKHVFGKQK